MKRVLHLFLTCTFRAAHTVIDHGPELSSIEW